MQHPQPGMTQQQTGSFGSRLPFNLQGHDQQQPHIQLQQSMVGAMGMRVGHGSATHFMMDARGRQDAPEAGYGDAQGKSSGQGGGNRES